MPDSLPPANDVICNRMKGHDSRTTFMDDFPDWSDRTIRNTISLAWISLLSLIAFAQMVGYDRSDLPS